MRSSYYRSRLPLLLVAGLVLAACSHNDTSAASSGSSASSTVQTTTARAVMINPSVATSPHRLLGVYAGGNPGTAYAAKALHWARDAGFGVVLNYSSIDAPPTAILPYLNLAARLHLKVIMSLSDLLGPTDLDPTNASWHRQFGATTDAQVTAIVRRYSWHPAVWGFSISDELPGGPLGLAKWLPALTQRQRQIAAITSKPVLVTLYWSGTNAAFYQSVKAATTDLAIDYYPIPQNPRYGPVSAISSIGQTLGEVAGQHNWFTLQGFGWSNGHHPEGKDLGFGKAAAPTASQMVAMAKQSVTAGARNLIVFSYDDNAPGSMSPNDRGNPLQLAAIKSAVHAITSSSWWRAG